MTLERIDGKWYVTIHNQSADTIGTLEIELTKKEKFYQDRSRMNNYFACGSIRKMIAEPTAYMMSFAISVPGEAVTISYEDSSTEDENIYSVGDNVEIIDYLGMIPEIWFSSVGRRYRILMKWNILLGIS